MRKWLIRLLRAGLSGAANSIGVMFVAPDIFNLGEGLYKLGLVALFGAIIGSARFLETEPLPEEV